jgi:outer membrane protein assembly factor BamE (lipoprotein component of BamABCDE complex)
MSTLLTMAHRHVLSSFLPLRALVVASVLVTAAACTPRIQQTGNLPDPVAVQEIQTGVHTRRDVASLLGSPSVVSTFQDSRWYYISQRQETIAFFAPEVVDQQVLEIRFNDEGTVQETQRYSLSDAEKVDPVGRETPTEGNEFSILQQLIGNIGRFSSTATTADE